MPILKLEFSNPTAGIPRKPVPLRYAVLVTGLDVKIMCALMSGELHYSDAAEKRAGPLLTAYELGPNASARTVTLHAIRDIDSQIRPNSKRKSQLKLIPRSFYVWSDDLANAFQNFIDLVPGRENAHLWGLELNWNPGLGDFAPLIEECPDPKDLGSKRSRQTAEVEKRDRQILAEYRKQKSQYPHLSKSNIAARIAKSGKYENVSGRIRRNLTPGTIRRLINRLL